MKRLELVVAEVLPTYDNTNFDKRFMFDLLSPEEHYRISNNGEYSSFATVRKVEQECGNHVRIVYHIEGMGVYPTDYGGHRTGSAKIPCTTFSTIDAPNYSDKKSDWKLQLAAIDALRDVEKTLHLHNKHGMVIGAERLFAGLIQKAFEMWGYEVNVILAKSTNL